MPENIPIFIMFVETLLFRRTCYNYNLISRSQIGPLSDVNLIIVFKKISFDISYLRLIKLQLHKNDEYLLSN